MKKRLSDLLVLSTLLLCIVLEIVSCKDMEDCRSLYDNTNIVFIEFKGHKSFKVDYAETISTSSGKKRLEDTFPGAKYKAFILEALKNLKGKRLCFGLPPQDTSITLQFYATPTDSQPNTITLHYHIKHSLLSPSCGIQEIYIIDNIETSFRSGTIVAPEGKVAKYSETKKPHVEISY